MDHLKKWCPFATLALGFVIFIYYVVMMAAYQFPIGRNGAMFLIAWAMGLAAYACFLGYAARAGKAYTVIIRELSHRATPRSVREQFFRPHNLN